MTARVPRAGARAGALRDKTTSDGMQALRPGTGERPHQGSLYALIALGYSMVYGVLKLLNFAHGDLYMVGAFVGYFVIQWFGGPTALSIPVPLLLLVMFLLAGGGVGALGVAIERFAYRPLRDAPRIAPLITALGGVVLARERMLLLFGA